MGGRALLAERKGLVAALLAGRGLSIASQGEGSGRESITSWEEGSGLAKGKGVGWGIAGQGEVSGVGALLAFLCLLSPSSFPPFFLFYRC